MDIIAEIEKLKDEIARQRAQMVSKWESGNAKTESITSRNISEDDGQE